MFDNPANDIGDLPGASARPGHVVGLRVDAIPLR
jgi:hypothetical protein